MFRRIYQSAQYGFLGSRQGLAPARRWRMAAALGGLILIACVLSACVPATQTQTGATNVAASARVTATQVQPEATDPSAGLRSASIQGTRFTYPAVLAQEAKGETVPAEAANTDSPWWLPAPQHLEIVFSGYVLSGTSQAARILVFPAGEFASTNTEARARIALLRQMLQSQSVVPATPLPFLPLLNATQQLQVGVRFLSFQGGHGVRYLTQYGQGPTAIANSDLVYTFQGLSDDGKTYVAVVLPVSHIMLPADAQSLPQNVRDALSADYPRYLKDTALSLASQPDASFRPSLADLDALAQSLVIGQ